MTGRPGSLPERLLRAARLRIGAVTALGFLVVALAGGMVSAVAVDVAIGRADDGRLTRSARAAAAWLAATAEGAARPRIEAIREIGPHEGAVAGAPPATTGTFLYVVDAAGAPLVTPALGPLGGTVARDVLQAYEQGVDIRNAAALLDGMAVPVRMVTVPVVLGEGGALAGYVRAVAPRSDLDAERNRILSSILVAGFISLCLGGIASLAVVRRVLGPVSAAFEREQRLIADASHEIRTPIAVIASAAELLEREGAVSAGGAPLLADIRAESARLRRLVDELLDLSRLEATRAPTLPLVPADLDLLVAEAARLGALLAPAGVMVRTGTVVRATAAGDADRLTGLIMALVENALRVAPAGTEVVLGLACEGRWARITVDDAGPGIPPEERDRLFQPFARREAGAGTGRGTGLGLTIARIVAEGHGGSLDIDRAPAGGARLVLRLPLV